MVSRILRRTFPLFFLGLFTLALTLALRWIIQTQFEIKLDQAFWYRDFIGNLFVTFLCYFITGTSTRAVILSSLLIIGFQLSNAGKQVMLGTPISPDDFIQIRNLFWLWQGWMLWATAAIVALPALAFLILTNWRRWSTWLTFAVLIIGVSTIGQYRSETRAWLDMKFGHSVWNQPENYRKRGLALHMAQEGIRAWAKVDDIPTEQQIAATTRPTTPIPTAKANSRNVHYVVLESFFDPNTLGKTLVPKDPLPKEFHDLWNQTGQSTTLSPVWGGYTANAEFEALCGFPITEDAVFFEGWLRQKAPCLPRVLSEAGYQTIASHPNVAGFWNRTLAYQLVGFEQYWDKRQFDLSDQVGGILLDHSFYQQIFEKIDSNDSRPVFNYMLTYHGHLPFPSNEQYPEIIPSGEASPLLRGFLNHMYYKSRDLMAMLEELRRQDPDSLIIIFGDHLPFLGPNHETYIAAGKLAQRRDQFTAEMFSYLVSTPLIVIDGERGPLNIGQLPLYRLPDLVLQLLGIGEYKMLHWTKNPENEIIRPLPGMHFVVKDGVTIVCYPETKNPDCKKSQEWVDDMTIISRDVFSGDQHSLNSSSD